MSNEDEFEQRVREIALSMPDEYPQGYARFLAEKEVNSGLPEHRGSGTESQS
ncbi:hypothetical protein HOS45_gp077 [Gordonia phage BirksAndSocks]|uniref:Uncharacterized protein n=1 Tax=Gordonia phage BirksAndSocks TaxID=2047831 RepID=A0A2H4YDF0_9CAUD|nr:hypothetical protein HOS45_gp077 [Gordonia phage BirksAndSocks]AUE22223.1 hypothetical protein SEA_BIRKSANDSOCKS_58 [Gordonia phage BirksAndSocks]